MRESPWEETDRILSDPIGCLQRKILRQEDETPERMFKWNGGATIYSTCPCSFCKPNLDTLEQERSWSERSAPVLASRKKPSPLPPTVMVSPYVWAHIEWVFSNKEDEEVKPKGFIVLQDPLGSLDKCKQQQRLEHCTQLER